MLVLGVNRIFQLCGIISGGRNYTCPIKEVDGKTFFKFKRAWHPVAEYLSDHAEELVREGGRVFSRPMSR